MTFQRSNPLSAFKSTAYWTLLYYCTPVVLDKDDRSLTLTMLKIKINNVFSSQTLFL
jgi:hypothetical protein